LDDHCFHLVWSLITSYVARVVKPISSLKLVRSPFVSHAKLPVGCSYLYAAYLETISSICWYVENGFV